MDGHGDASRLRACFLRSFCKPIERFDDRSSPIYEVGFNQKDSLWERWKGVQIHFNLVTFFELESSQNSRFATTVAAFSSTLQL